MQILPILSPSPPLLRHPSLLVRLGRLASLSISSFKSSPMFNEPTTADVMMEVGSSYNVHMKTIALGHTIASIA